MLTRCQPNLTAIQEAWNTQTRIWRIQFVHEWYDHEWHHWAARVQVDVPDGNLPLRATPQEIYDREMPLAETATQTLNFDYILEAFQFACERTQDACQLIPWLGTLVFPAGRELIRKEPLENLWKRFTNPRLYMQSMIKTREPQINIGSYLEHGMKLYQLVITPLLGLNPDTPLLIASDVVRGYAD